MGLPSDAVALAQQVLQDAAAGNTKSVKMLRGAYNKCATCGLETTQAKYCPYCGPEMQHLPAERKCVCGEQVLFADAKFCGWCQRPLES